MTTDMREDLAVVVPCYNTGDRLRPVIEGLANYVDHIIVVDDGCTDGAPQALSNTPARVVGWTENRGKGFALLEGFRAALEGPSVTAVAVVDADGQHDPAELSGLYETMLREEADLVIGSREFGQSHVPLRSRVGNVLTISLSALILGTRLPDTQSGYRVHSRQLVEHILETIEGGRYETEMEIIVRTVRDGFKVVPSPIRTIYEEGNPSSHFNKLRDSWRIWRQLIRASLRK